MEEYLTFDDVLIKPQYSHVLPSNVSTKSQFSTHIELDIPICSAAMDTVTEGAMALAMARHGGIGCVHRNLSRWTQSDQISIALENKNNVAAAVGVDDFERLEMLVTRGIKVVVIDTAHGHSFNVIQSISEYKKRYPTIDIVAGNIATALAARDLINAGADGIKVGVGPGGICTTRMVAGVGVPQLSAILSISKICREYSIPLIADGGIRSSGDIVKAIAAGADCVMIGGLLAGCFESPGKLIEDGDKKYKIYRGMGSMEAMLESEGSRKRYNQGDVMTPEGITTRIEFRGSIDDVIKQLVGGLRSGMGYCGTKTIDELKSIGESAFIRITNAGLIESKAHINGII